MKIYTVTEEALRTIISDALCQNPHTLEFNATEKYLNRLVEASKQTCQYNEESEGYTAPSCLKAGEHVEGCQYYEHV